MSGAEIDQRAVEIEQIPRAAASVSLQSRSRDILPFDRAADRRNLVARALARLATCTHRLKEVAAQVAGPTPCAMRRAGRDTAVPASPLKPKKSGVQTAP